MGSPDVINQWFLAGAGMALVPIIIHLVQRRRIRQVVFSSVRFLRTMSQRVVRRRRLTELLLILLRTVALAALALAFARPFFRERPRGLSGDAILEDQAALILVDNSYSMRVGGRLESAKQHAMELLDDLGQGPKVGIASFSQQLQPLSQIGSDPAEARKAIEAIQPSWRGTNLSLVLAAADRHLSDRAKERRQIFLISDFQRSAWESGGNWKLSNGTVLSVKNVSEKELSNVLIERVEVPRLVVAGGSPQVVSAKIVNTTDQLIPQAAVTFTIGQKVVERTSVNLRPRAAVPVRFRYTFKDPGDVTGSISVVAKDAMSEDNVAYFCVHVTPQVRVLVVNGDPARQFARNDGFFLGVALAPPVKDRSGFFSVSEVSPAQLEAKHLEETDAVFFTNVAGISSTARQAVKEFLERGGGVCFVCGENSQPDRFNEAMADLAPCKLRRKAMGQGEQPAVISVVDLKHEIFVPFAGPHTGNLALAEFVQYYEVERLQAASVLARFSTGHPALLEIRIGKGKSILFPSAMDLEWNNLCLKSVFVPFIHQLAKRLWAEHSAGVRNVIIGDKVTYQIAHKADKVELQRPDGSKAPLGIQTSSDGFPTVSFTPERPGVYELTFGQTQVRFAANLDAREPDLRPLSGDDIKELVSSVQPRADESVKDGVKARPVVGEKAARERVENQQKLWWYLIGLVLLALAAEMVLATRAGTS